VRAARRSAQEAQQALHAAQVEALLRRAPDQLDGPDPLVIRRIDYYFHENIMPVDFGAPNAYAPREEWRRQVQALSRDKVGAAAVADYARRDLLAGHTVRTTQQGVSEGIARGVDASGALQLQTSAGLVAIHSGEVSVRLDPSA